MREWRDGVDGASSGLEFELVGVIGRGAINGVSAGEAMPGSARLLCADVGMTPLTGFGSDTRRGAATGFTPTGA
jgi:hypothetical protein